MKQEVLSTNLDLFLFRYLRDTLRNKSPEDIASFYVQNFVFKNADYFERIIKEYKLPGDFLKIHQKICKLAENEKLFSENVQNPIDKL